MSKDQSYSKIDLTSNCLVHMCMSMLNVLLVPVNDLVSHPIRTRFIFIAEKMMERFNVDFYVLRYASIPTSSNVKRKLDFKLVEFRDFKSRSVGLYYTINSIPILSALSHQLRREKIDAIIHANIIPSTIAVKLGKVFHKPLIFDFQDYFPESAASYFQGRFLKSLTYSLTSKVTRFNIKHSNAVVTVTNAHKEKIMEYDPTKLVKVIPNGVDAELFRPMPKHKALKKLDMEEFENKTILIYFGSIDPWLDFQTLLKAIKGLVRKKVDVVLFIIGFCHTGYFLEEIRQSAERAGIGDRLFFFDPVPQDRLVYYINASDVTLAPYKLSLKNQAVPLKMLESIACGRYVCVTRLPEIVRRFGDVVGLYSSEDELESVLLKYVRGQVETPDGKMRKIAREYSWDGITNSYYHLINQAIERNNQ